MGKIHLRDIDNIIDYAINGESLMNGHLL